MKDLKSSSLWRGLLYFNFYFVEFTIGGSTVYAYSSSCSTCLQCYTLLNEAGNTMLADVQPFDVYFVLSGWLHEIGF